MLTASVLYKGTAYQDFKASDLGALKALRQPKLLDLQNISDELSRKISFLSY